VPGEVKLTGHLQLIDRCVSIWIDCWDVSLADGNQGIDMTLVAKVAGRGIPQVEINSRASFGAGHADDAASSHLHRAAW
jgi:hypothetical protein